MPIFDLAGPSVTPFRRLQSDTEIYEREIEDLFWENLEAFAGEPLFPVGRQLALPGGGIPDIVALDTAGRVVVMEIKRDVDRSQVSQCLEYAGWGRQASLEDLARLYRAGPSQFFTDWQAFTRTDTPVLLNRIPRLVLVARTFDGRTRSALDYLQETGVPVTLITVVFYADTSGGRIVDVSSDREALAPSVDLDPTLTRMGTPSAPRFSSTTTLSDLLEAGVLDTGEPIEWRRPQVGEEYRAIVADTGEVVLADGRRFTSLTSAANGAAGGSNNGWICWTVPRLGGVTVGSLRANS